MIGYAFLVGIAQVWLKTIPISLFLKHFGSTSLPYVYIASALLLVISGIFYSVMERKLAPIRLLYLFFVLLAALFFVLWFFLVGALGNWVYLVLLIGAQASFDIFELQLWGALNRVFTLDQGKRMFGSIGMCQTLAWILGNVALPLLLKITVPYTLILAASIAILCAMGALHIIFNTYPEKFSNAEQARTVAERKSEAAWYANPYLTNNMLFAIFSLFIFTVVDITFYTVSNEVFSDEIKLASFLGLFFAMLNIFDLFCRGVVASLVINKLGILSGLLIRTFGVAILVVLIFVDLPMNNLYSLFLLCITMKLLDEGLSNSVLRQAVLLLYQPLSRKLRSWLQSKIELFAIPLATIFAGSSLIFIQRVWGIHVFFAMVLITIALLATMAVTLFLKKGYIEQLKRALSKHAFSNDKKHLDSTSAHVLLQRLTANNPDEVLYCLGLLEKSPQHLFEKGLGICLYHPSTLVKYAAASKLQHFKSKNSIPRLAQIFIEERDPLTRAAAFRALLFQKKEDIAEEIERYIDASDPLVEDEAIAAALLYNRDTSLSRRAYEKLQRLIHSLSAPERIRACKILGRLDMPNYLVMLLRDQDLSVVRSAMAAIPSFSDQKLHEIVIEDLKNEELRPLAVSTLINAGSRALPSIEKALEAALATKDTKTVALLITILGHVGGDEAIGLLVQTLQTCENRILKCSILEALAACNYKTLSFEMIQTHLSLEIEHLNTLVTLAQQLTAQEGCAPLSSSLERQVRFSQKQLFLLLGFIYPQEDIRKIAYYIAHRDSDRASYADELLENILQKTHRTALLPILRQSYGKGFIPPSTADIHAVIRAILAASTQKMTAVLKATALFTIAQLRLTQFIEEVRDSLGDEDGIVRETAQWTLERI